MLKNKNNKKIYKINNIKKKKLHKNYKYKTNRPIK